MTLEDGGQIYGPRRGKAIGLARAFHWPLEFPDVFAAGGFDVVLGNPPWERIKVPEKFPRKFRVEWNLLKGRVGLNYRQTSTVLPLYRP